MNLAGALRAIRSARDKSAYYRMWHLRQRAGMAYPGEPSPHAPVPFELALVSLGKESGKLEECLRLLADYFAAEDRAVLTVIKRAAYPMLLFLAATFIGPLPLLFTGNVGLYFATALGGFALWAVSGGALLMGAVGRYTAQPKFVIGRLLRALTYAIEAGLPLGRAAQLAAEASGDAGVIRHVRMVGARVTQQPLADTFRGCPHVDFSIVAAMEVADASGDYTGALKKRADLLES